jgi:hypothetical protein
MILQNPLPRLWVWQLHFEPQFDSTASHESWRQMLQIHGGHHHADASSTFAFQATEHR